MNVSFKGVYDARILLGYQDKYPVLRELKSSEKNILRLTCKLDDDEFGNHLSELKRVTAKSNILEKEFAKFASNDILTLDIAKSRQETEHGYSIKLNSLMVNQQDAYSIFAIVTFLCSLTNYLQILQSDPKSVAIKYLRIINNIVDKVGQRALSKV